MVALALLMTFLWPDFAPYVETLETLLEQPLYVALLGEETLGLTSLEGLIAMELFVVGDIVFVALILLFGVVSIAREVDSGTLDFMLSYPVPRWKFLLEKLLAFITVTLGYPVLTCAAAILGAIIIGEDFNSGAFLIALLGRWLLYITLTIIVILCSLIFMESSKTLGLAGLILGGSYIAKVLGGLVGMANPETADVLQGISLFYYLDGSAVMKAVMSNEAYPLAELAVLLAVGITALIASLALFQKREFK